MSRHLATSIIVVGGGLTIGVIALTARSKPLTQLNVVKCGIERGKPVVFFQVEGAEGRRVAIFNVLRIEGDETEGSLVERPYETFTPAAEFWAPNQRSPIGLPEEGRKEFGIVAPTAAVWKLRITLDVEDPNSLRRFTRMSSLVEVVGKVPLRNLRDLAASMWHTRYTHPEFIESQLITNAVAFGSTK